MTKHEEILKSIGLDNNEAKVYLEAIKLWPTQASVIGKVLNIPRTSVKYTCDELVKKNIMSKSNKWNTSIYTAEKPSVLTNQLQIQKNKLENDEANLNSIMWDLIWFYNPHTRLPKVTFYEWEDGIIKMIDECLSSKETIDSFVDLEKLLSHGPEINKYFTSKRNSKKIHKRTIYENKENIKNQLNKKVTDEHNEIKYIKSSHFKVYISVMIFDGKISYISFKNWNLFWVIIEDDDIYHFHKNIFNLIWDTIT